MRKRRVGKREVRWMGKAVKMEVEKLGKRKVGMLGKVRKREVAQMGWWG